MTLLLPLAVAAATFAAVAWLSGRREARVAGRRVAAYVEAPRPTLPTAETEVLRSRRDSAAAASERFLRRVPGWARYAALVERSGSPVSAVELTWIAASASVLLLLVGLVAGGPVAAVVLELCLIAGVRSWLVVRVGRRRRAFDEQLPEFLFDVGSALRVGHGFNQALQAVALEAPDPIGKEFSRVIAEARLGRSLEDALHDLGARVSSADLTFVIEAVVVQRQVGGSLAAVFEIVAESVRQRQQYALRVRALTAMGRLSAMVVLALPFGLALLLSATHHDYLRPLVASRGALIVSIGALGLVGAGAVWLRRLTSVEQIA